MGNITVEIQSRCLYVSNDERKVAELFEMTGMVEYADDTEAGNDFDVEIRSDLNRFKTSVSVDLLEQAQADQRDLAIIGTRTASTVFTRHSSGTWVADTLQNYRAWFYDSSLPDGGHWLNVSDNSTSTITVESGTIESGANRVQLQARPKIRNMIQIYPRCDFYGSFFQYKITKIMSAVNGTFKWFNLKGSAIPVNADPEFFVGLETITNGW